MTTLLYPLKLLCSTIAFLSWIPIPQWAVTDKALYRMGIFFPLVGGILGGLAAFVVYTANIFFPYPVSIALTLLAYGWITGAFHEDALADAADGMGGYDSKKILEIMRDSRIGSYGSFAMISMYVLRYAALTSIDPNMAIRNIISYAAVSRMTGVLFLTLTQTKEIPPESLSRTIPFSNQWGCCVLGMLFTTIIVLTVAPSNPVLIPLLLIGIPFLARMYFLKRIGYITGDCAGCVIHITETILHVFATAA